jgi:hypothetical protein
MSLSSRLRTTRQTTFRALTVTDLMPGQNDEDLKVEGTFHNLTEHGKAPAPSCLLCESGGGRLSALFRAGAEGLA